MAIAAIKPIYAEDYVQPPNHGTAFPARRGSVYVPVWTTYTILLRMYAKFTWIVLIPARSIM